MAASIGQLLATRLLILLILFLLIQPSFGALRHIQLFFRHGQRTPTSFLRFPTEPGAPSADVSKLDLGELTPEGMWQEYRLGMALRSIYGQFLGDQYRSREINVYSGRDNRTIASAQLVLAGLFPPRGDQVWNKALLWQPIPVVTNPILDHPSFGMLDHCPAEKARVEKSQGYGQMWTRFGPEIADLKEKTGLDIPDLNIFQKVQDAIVTRAELPKLLPLPAWARQPDYLDRIKRSRLELHEGQIDQFLDGMGGWHLDQLLGPMDNVAAANAGNGTQQQRAILYSAHDTNFLTLGRFLGINAIDAMLPDYASLLAFELHQNERYGQHYVQVKFRNGLNGSEDLVELKIADCPAPCPLAKFRTLRPRVKTAQWLSRCEGWPLGGGNDQCTAYGPIAAVLLVLVVLLIASVLSLLLSCRSYKRRYEEAALLNEKSPLLANGR